VGDQLFAHRAPTGRKMLSLFAVFTAGVHAATKPHLIAMLMDDFGCAFVLIFAILQQRGVTQPARPAHAGANVGYHRTPADDPHHEVQTPNIDALVASGVQLDRFYAHKFCSPTRSALQSGRSPVFVNVENSDIAQYNPAVSFGAICARKSHARKTTPT